MRALIVSDTHGKHKGIEQAILLERPFDLLIHLGDGDGYEDYYESLADCPIEIIAGNNDFFSALPREKIIEIEELRILMVHGHMHYAEYGLDELMKAAERNNCNCVFYGHTHRPLVQKEKKIMLVNPGSLTYPRQPGRKPSYILMEKKPGKEPFFYIKYLT